MSLHALVVDADDLQRDVVRVALSPDGWTVCEARSLAEAEEVIGRHQPALVFCETVSYTHLTLPTTPYV